MPETNLPDPYLAPYADPLLQGELLRFARACLEAAVRGVAAPAAPGGGPFETAPGLFVTLTVSGELRGCIGHIKGRLPLAAAVPELCRAAALEDPRFYPVAPDELAAVRIELSLLTPHRPVDDWRLIRIGLDGVLLFLRGRQAVFLPQVPVEQGWDLAATLGALSVKAGLGPEAWREPDCHFEVFQAIHFAESP